MNLYRVIVVAVWTMAVPAGALRQDLQSKMQDDAHLISNNTSQAHASLLMPDAPAQAAIPWVTR